MATAFDKDEFFRILGKDNFSEALQYTHNCVPDFLCKWYVLQDYKSEENAEVIQKKKEQDELRFKSLTNYQNWFDTRFNQNDPFDMFLYNLDYDRLHEECPEDMIPVYEKQEDKEAIFDAVDTLELCLKTVTPMLDTMKTLPANMRRAAAKGFINATDCADYLTKKGMPFRDAYKLTGCMVSDCIAADKTLEELPLTQFQSYSPLFEDDIYDAIDLVHCCEGRTSYGGPSAASVQRQIALAKARLDAWEEENA